MFAEYIQAALEKAEYEIIDNPDPNNAHIPDLVGVWAAGKTIEERRTELIDVIEEWILAKRDFHTGSVSIETLPDRMMKWRVKA